MSIDKSLKSQNSLVRHRNVLTRAERLEKLEEEERWSENDPVTGFPKVAHRKVVVAKKDKAKAEETDEAAADATAEAAPAGDQAEKSAEKDAK